MVSQRSRKLLETYVTDTLSRVKIGIVTKAIYLSMSRKSVKTSGRKWACSAVLLKFASVCMFNRKIRGRAGLYEHRLEQIYVWTRLKVQSVYISRTNPVRRTSLWCISLKTSVCPKLGHVCVQGGHFLFSNTNVGERMSRRVVGLLIYSSTSTCELSPSILTLGTCSKYIQQTYILLATTRSIA